MTTEQQLREALEAIRQECVGKDWNTIIGIYDKARAVLALPQRPDDEGVDNNMTGGGDPTSHSGQVGNPSPPTIVDIAAGARAMVRVEPEDEDGWKPYNKLAMACAEAWGLKWK